MSGAGEPRLDAQRQGVPAQRVLGPGPGKNHWLKVRLVGGMPKRAKGSNRDGIGALVTVKGGGITQRQWVKSGGSFMSQSSLELLFGLGQARQVDAVEVLWPSGPRDRLPSVPVERRIVVEEGQGQVH